MSALRRSQLMLIVICALAGCSDDSSAPPGRDAGARDRGVADTIDDSVNLIVLWEIDEKSDVAACATHGIDHIRVSGYGGIDVDETSACASLPWEIRLSIAPATYLLNVALEDASDQVIANRQITDITVLASGTPTRATARFVSSEL